MIMSMEIEWRDIPGYEGLYQVSNTGEFRRVWANKTTPKALHTDRAGYKRAKLYKNGKARTVLVAVAVAEAFIGPRPDGMEVCHNDGNNQNNHVNNLRYDTPLNNRRDKKKHGTAGNQYTRQEACRNGHVWTPESTGYYGRRKARYCKTCELSYRGG
ncbi:hypothetical protein EMG21_26050 [Klebsiella pneumoniae]|nr:hypothetical protein EMG21_26050 [Klebsiella pneumoniae]